MISCLIFHSQFKSPLLIFRISWLKNSVFQSSSRYTHNVIIWEAIIVVAIVLSPLWEGKLTTDTSSCFTLFLPIIPCVRSALVPVIPLSHTLLHALARLARLLSLGKACRGGSWKFNRKLRGPIIFWGVKWFCIHANDFEIALFKLL